MEDQRAEKFFFMIFRRPHLSLLKSPPTLNSLCGLTGQHHLHSVPSLSCPEMVLLIGNWYVQRDCSVPAGRRPPTCQKLSQEDAEEISALGPMMLTVPNSKS